MSGRSVQRGKRAEAARLVVADDHELIRSGIRSMLAGEPDMEVVGEAENGRQALTLCRRLEPDLVLMDVRMPEMDGLEATRTLKEERPTTGVIMLTMYDNQDYLLEALRSGAAGYVLKGASRETLTAAIREALDGEFPFDRNLVTRLLRRLASETAAQPSPEENPPATLARQPLPDSLTPRELQILRLLARGFSNRRIAEELVISPGTVKTHIKRITRKLKVSDRTQAAIRAVEAGLLDPDS